MVNNNARKEKIIKIIKIVKARTRFELRNKKQGEGGRNKMKNETNFIEPGKLTPLTRIIWKFTIRVTCYLYLLQISPEAREKGIFEYNYSKILFQRTTAPLDYLIFTIL